MLFDIAQVGGIRTYHLALKKGLEELGNKVTSYFIEENKERLTGRGFCEKVIGYMTEDMVKGYKKEIGDKDLLIFTSPCPYQSKHFTSRKWQILYKIAHDRGVPIIVILHDPYLPQRYKWLTEVKSCISGISCVQGKAYVIAKRYFENLNVSLHPMELEDMGLYANKKEDLVISANWFKRWKYIDLLIKAIPLINHRVEVYSDGIERRKMSGKKRDETYRDEKGDWIWEKALEGGMIYKGVASDEELLEAYKKQKVGVDMAHFEGYKELHPIYPWLKSTDYSVLETMKYGGIPVVRATMGITGILGENNFLVVSEGNIVKSLAEKVNYVVELFDDFKGLREKNLEILKRHFDKRVVAKRVLSVLKESEGVEQVTEKLVTLERWI